MKKVIMLFVFLMGIIVQLTCAVPNKQEADEAYQKDDFKTAIKIYEELLETKGESADVYYNLANSYYKNKNIAKAILNYERALLLAPGDADIRFNLELAKSKSVDQIIPTPEVFIITWGNAIVNSMNEKAWSRMGICSFIFLLLALILYIFSNRIWMKKVGFVAALCLLVVCICANFSASQQKNEQTHRSGAIILAPSVTVKSTPTESGTDLFVLHEGTKVLVEDDSMKEWKEIRLEDGKKGWLPSSTIERI